MTRYQKDGSLTKALQSGREWRRTAKGSYMKKTKKEKEIPQINLWYLDKIRKLCERNKISALALHIGFSGES